MNLGARIWSIIRNLAFRHKTENDLDGELRAYVDMLADEKVAAGMSPSEARRSALVEFGGVEQVRQAVRDRRAGAGLESLWQDVRYGLRTMARNPGFAILAVLMLAVGIGASTTAFDWMDQILLRPLDGVTQPQNLVALVSTTANHAYVPISYPDYQDFRDRLRLVEGVAVAHPTALSVGKEERAERVWGELVSGNFFAVLGVKPELGRMFSSAEYGDKPGAFPVAVISDRFWRTHYGSDPRVVGRTIRVNSHELTIIGVAPPDFHGSLTAEAYDLWVPYMEQPMLNGVEAWMLRDRGNRNMLAIARLKTGVTLGQAQEELSALAGRMAVADADMDQGMGATLLPLSESPFGPQGLLAGPLRILMGISVLLLLIVCANVASLLLARATAREREFSTRLALGAGRWRLIRQVLTEILLLTGIGAALGIVSVPWLSRTLQLLMPPGQPTLDLNTRLNLHVLIFTAGLCVLATVSAGVIPALQSGRTELSARINEGGRSGVAGRGRHRLRSILVISEVALALVALVCAGLFVRAFEEARGINPGFDPNHVLLTQFYLATNGYNLEQRKEFCRQLGEKMMSAPGVVDVAWSDGVPLSFEPSWWEDLEVRGYVPLPGENMKIFRNVVSPDYLKLMRIPLMTGRNFTEQDNEKSELVMIVNQTFAQRFFAGQDPVGRHVRGFGEWFTVVGEARDSKYNYLGESPTPYFYVPFRQIYRADMQLAFYVKVHGDSGAMLPILRNKVREIDPNVTVFDAMPLQESVGATLYPQKLAATLLMILGALAVLLAALGLYSVMAYAVVQRTQEIGIRMALGARRIDVLGMVEWQALILTGAGLAVGMVLALACSRSLASLSFTDSAMGGGVTLAGEKVMNPLIYAGAAVFLAAVGALAALLPAHRAASVEPMRALRTD